MTKKIKLNYALAITAIAISFFSGYQNLKYGLSFIDEGMYLTDAWRIAKGDQLIHDTAKFAPTLYQAISSLLFRLNESLNILDVRIIQHFIAASCLLLLAFSSTASDPKRLPFRLIILAPFFYTGLDQTGMSASFNYYTISQALLLIYLSEHLSSENAKPVNQPELNRRAILSSTLIAGMIVTYLPLIILVPIHLAFLKIFKSQTTKKLLLNLAVIAGIYSLTVGSEFSTHFENIMSIGNGRKEGALTINLYTPATIFLGSVIGAGLTLFLRASTEWDWKKFTLVSAIFGLGLAYSQLNHYFGILPPFWNGWFNIPGATAGITFGLMLALFFQSIKDAKENIPQPSPSAIADYARSNQQLAPLVLTGAYVSAYSATSTLGVMLFSNSLPIVLILLTLKQYKFRKINEEASDRGQKPDLQYLKGILVMSIALGAPLAHHDHQFTYFDKAPQSLDTKIETGPAAGIVTNQLNAKLYEDIRKFVLKNTSEEDFILSFDQTPMTYFMTGRLPSLDHSWIGLTGGDPTAMKKSIAKMIESSRLPKLAIHWRNKFLWLPIDKAGNYALSGFADSTEGVLLSFVRSNMVFAGSIDVGEERAVEIYLWKNQNQEVSVDE